jgi:hypothetical protein
MKTIDALLLATCCALSHLACSSDAERDTPDGASGDPPPPDAGGSDTQRGDSSADPGADAGGDPPLVWEDGGIGEISDEPASCETSQIKIEFEPMYSAYDGIHLFQVPATVASIDPEAITWSLSDPAIADLAIVPNGVMLTIQKAGTATLIASAGSLCGTSLLTVTEFEPELWEIGAARYNAGMVLNRGLRATGEPIEAACTSCHGESATDGLYRTVAHTPAQTAGFSDEELIKIITEATLPEGAYFDESILKKEMWQQFHKWKMQDDQRQAIVVYLRSLTPSAQTGDSAGGGMMSAPPDGGMVPP